MHMNSVEVQQLEEIMLKQQKMEQKEKTLLSSIEKGEAVSDCFQLSMLGFGECAGIFALSSFSAVSFLCSKAANKSIEIARTSSRTHLNFVFQDFASTQPPAFHFYCINAVQFL